jgi:SSS family solute:Na+ symporter
MVVMRDIYANMPIFIGLGGSLLSYIVVSLLDKPTPAAILREWNSRSSAPRAEADVVVAPDAKDAAYRPIA